MRIPFPFIAYTHDDLCRKIRDYIQSFGKGCRIIRRAEFLEEIRYVRTKLFAVCDITFDDVMCIPWGKQIVRYLPDPFSLE